MNQDPEVAELVNGDNRPMAGPQLRQKLSKLLSICIPLLFIIFQLFRLISFVMFAIFAVYCTLYLDSSTVDCQNFTVYRVSDVSKCDAYCWKMLWLICSILTSIICTCLLNQSVIPDLRPVSCAVIWRCLLYKPYFWSLNITVVFVILYDILIITRNHKAKKDIEILVIVSKILTLYLIYQLNFTFPPSREKNFRPIVRAVYYITLSIYALDNLCKFLVLTTEIAFKFYTVNRTAPEPLAIIVLILMIINGSLYHSFLQFFWEKLFRGDKDILTVIKQNFSDTPGINEYIEDGNGGGV
ncbi:uncharacterized protein [Montipora capricornis]|uniref:uncharacterized protein n=1 Tax=Montipora foliosa TaxID=591990 RepID=UPI0035F1F852